MEDTLSREELEDAVGSLLYTDGEYGLDGEDKLILDHDQKQRTKMLEMENEISTQKDEIEYLESKIEYLESKVAWLERPKY
jgi:polyhydroxyalkanoate synthesis regulator phasin